MQRANKSLYYCKPVTLQNKVTSAIARAVGAGDLFRAAKLIWHALVVTFGSAMFFLLLYLCFGTYLLVFLGGVGLTLEQSQGYCLVLFCGGIFIWPLSIIGAIFRGTGDMKFPAMLMIVAPFIQVPLSGALVLGLGGAPPLGIVGAAISAIVSGLVASTMMMFKLAKGSQALKIKWSACQLSLLLFRDIFKVARLHRYRPYSRSQRFLL